VKTASETGQTQAAAAVLMVRPASFAHNAQTAGTNRFQHVTGQSADVARAAQAEFDAAVSALSAEQVHVCVVDDTPEPHKPDALFPNNWISFHQDGTVVLYPMLAPNRRLERRLEIIEVVARRLGFRQRRLLDLSGHERQGRILEGTGSLVLDHVRRLVYASRSARTDDSLVRLWADEMQYQPVLFDAVGVDGTPIYHTNVLLSVGRRAAVVCAEAIVDGDRQRVLASLRERCEVIEIPMALMSQFGANVLELGTERRSVLALSQRAFDAFQSLPGDDWQRLQRAVDRLLPVPIFTIEAVGGGGIRCMLAEVPVVSA
jgi:hypothetical protein